MATTQASSFGSLWAIYHRRGTSNSANPPNVVDAISEKFLNVKADSLIHAQTRVYCDTKHHIYFGQGCIIGERVEIGRKVSSASASELDSDNISHFHTEQSDILTTEIDNCVTVNADTRIQAGVHIGQYTQVEDFVVIEAHVQIGSFCKILPYTRIPAHTIIPDNTVVFDKPACLPVLLPDRTLCANTNLIKTRITAHSQLLAALRQLHTLLPNVNTSHTSIILTTDTITPKVDTAPLPTSLKLPSQTSKIPTG